MPGMKRKVDEDTWIVSQSKKFKASSLLSNVYARTLAQLRMGARRFFHQQEQVDYNEKENEEGATASSPSRSSTSAAMSPPGSPLAVQDVISHNDLEGIRPRPKNVCDSCRGKVIRHDAGWESCYYCDEVVCHVNPCVTCNYSFCSNCSLANYDSCPSGESYLCYGCRS